MSCEQQRLLFVENGSYVLRRVCMFSEKGVFLRGGFQLWKLGGLDGANSAGKVCRPVPKTGCWAGPCFCFLGKSVCCYINGHHKQYILVDTMFNYIFHVGPSS